MSGPIVVRVTSDVILDLRWRVLAPGRPRSEAHMALDHDPRSRHWALQLGGVVIGAVSVMPVRGLVLRGMAVDPAHQRMGHGRRLLCQVHNDVAAPMWCNARASAVDFYLAAGWNPVGPRFEMDDQGAHQRLTWAPPASGGVGGAGP